jgi:hypothetical protein
MTVNTVSLEGGEWICFSYTQNFVELVQQHIVFASTFLKYTKSIVSKSLPSTYSSRLISVIRGSANNFSHQYSTP